MKAKDVVKRLLEILEHNPDSEVVISSIAFDGYTGDFEIGCDDENNAEIYEVAESKPF